MSDERRRSSQSLKSEWVERKRQKIGSVIEEKMLHQRENYN